VSSDLLDRAITLRQQGHIEESRQLLFSLLEGTESKGPIYLNIAWSWDNQGRETEALTYYHLSLEEKLTEEDAFEATFGLACTYRCLGELNKAEDLFIQLRRAWPDALEVIPFYALCLSSLGKKEDAIRMLFELILENPPTNALHAYQKTLSTYLNDEYPKP